jgi:hypothetical protein
MSRWMFSKSASQSQASKTKKPQIARMITDQESANRTVHSRCSVACKFRTAFSIDVTLHDSATERNRVNRKWWLLFRYGFHCGQLLLLPGVEPPDDVDDVCKASPLQKATSNRAAVATFAVDSNSNILIERR